MAQNIMIPKLVAIYTRKSSEGGYKQAKSHERQQHEIKAFCKNHNLIITKKFSDDVSASNSNHGSRPGLTKLLDWLDKDAGNMVVMSEVSRMSRHLSIWSDVETRLHQFRFVELGNQEPNEVIISIFLALAAQESKKIKMRVKSAYDARVAEFGKGNFKWGNPNIKDHAAKGRATKTRIAKEHWSNILTMDAYLYKFASLYQKDRVIELNKMGYKTQTGRPITSSNLSRAHTTLGTGCAKSAAGRIKK